MIPARLLDLLGRLTGACRQRRFGSGQLEPLSLRSRGGGLWFGLAGPLIGGISQRRGRQPVGWDDVNVSLIDERAQRPADGTQLRCGRPLCLAWWEVDIASELPGRLPGPVSLLVAALRQVPVHGPLDAAPSSTHGLNVSRHATLNCGSNGGRPVVSPAGPRRQDSFDLESAAGSLALGPQPESCRYSDSSRHRTPRSEPRY